MRADDGNFRLKIVCRGRRNPQTRAPGHHPVVLGYLVFSASVRAESSYSWPVPGGFIGIEGLTYKPNEAQGRYELRKECVQPRWRDMSGAEFEDGTVADVMEPVPGCVIHCPGCRGRNPSLNPIELDGPRTTALVLMSQRKGRSKITMGDESVIQLASKALAEWQGEPDKG